MLTRKPLSATEEEVHRNPATRTCRLFAAVAATATEQE
jgi:16S rRNA C1402 N4-methylase RsmH